jgi:hypothetical protein
VALSCHKRLFRLMKTVSQTAESASPEAAAMADNAKPADNKRRGRARRDALPRRS